MPRARARRRSSNGNLIMVTSALPGEGKSFTARQSRDEHRDGARSHGAAGRCRRRAAVAARDARACRRRAACSTCWSTTASTCATCCSRTEHREAVDPAERRTASARHRAARERGDEPAARGHVASRYSDRIIIFDSPPLLVTTESRVLATHMGQVVIVVEARARRRRRAVKQALATIEACPVRLMMLNKARASIAGQQLWLWLRLWLWLSATDGRSLARATARSGFWHARCGAAGAAGRCAKLAGGRQRRAAACARAATGTFAARRHA